MVAERRPVVDREHRSEVRGVYVIGDVVDAPSIKLALAQGRAVGGRIADELAGSGRDDEVLDVVVLGAGPAGIAAAEAAREQGLRVLILEAERPFHTMHAFPPGKIIFAEPHALLNETGLPFDEGRKEEIAKRWDRWLRRSGLTVHAGERVEAIARDGDQLIVRSRIGAGGRSSEYPTLDGARDPGSALTYRTRRVVVAVGKRGAIRKLGVEGEECPNVHYALVDPEQSRGRRVLVVGGGDSAVEAALALAEAGALVALSYRGATLGRPKERNRVAFERAVSDGRIDYRPETSVVRLSTTEAILRGAEGPVHVPIEEAFVFIGADPPRALLRSMGIRLEGELRWRRFAWVVGFMALVYAFYALKRGEGFWPFGAGDPLAVVPDWLTVDLGFRTVDAGFWGTVVYSALVVGFGVDALRRYGRWPEQRRRYLSLMVFQAVFLFGIPEIIVPGLHALSQGLAGAPGQMMSALTARGWAFYALSVPWPLSVWSLVHAPEDGGGAFASAVVWSGSAALVSFVAIPLYVRRNNEKFCSYLCGCGGLAETLGDRWRHLAPRGPGSRRVEWAGVVILGLAVPVTALLVADAWALLSSPFWLDTKVFAQGWYGLMVDFMLASLVGVALYPVLGNRVWCRFFCPLRAYMQGFARAFGRLKIRSNDRCISCGECTRVCQMGIDVQRFAEGQTAIDNANSACIQCGMCVIVCPMGVLELEG